MHDAAGLLDFRQRTLHLRGLDGVPGFCVAGWRERDFPGDEVFRTSVPRVGTATDCPAKAATIVISRQTMAVTISSTLCTINAINPMSAVIAPQAPETFVNLGLRRAEDVRRGL